MLPPSRTPAALRGALCGLALLLAGCGYEAEKNVGVRRDGEAVVAHFVLCRGDRVTQFRLTDYGLAYGSGLVGPVLWEIDSSGERVDTIRFGTVPRGFNETVAYHGIRDVERIVVTNHSGDDMMSFSHGELRKGSVLRADYERLSPATFRTAGRKNCRDRVYDDVLGLGVTTPLLLVIFLAASRLRRRTRTWTTHAVGAFSTAVVAVALVGAIVVWTRVLLIGDVTGAELPVGLLGLLLFFGWLLVPGLAIAIGVGALAQRRRGAREPTPQSFRWRLAVAAFPLALALAALTELIRPWTTLLPP